MTFIRTLTGDISPEELGFTYSHEHIICVPDYWREKKVDDMLLDDPVKSQADVQDFANLGGNTIVDATAVDYGRRVEDVVRLSNATNIQIIGTAGFNKKFLWEAKIPDHIKKIVGNYDTFLEWIEKATIEELTEFVVNEVVNGLEGTSYRAGQVKFGTGYNTIHPLEEKTIRAVARAHHITKAPVHSHTEFGTMALEQIEILREENVDLKNVSFGHMDRNLDPFYHAKVAETGAFLSFDGIGKIKYAPEIARIDAILSLVEKGYEKQILISGDIARKTYLKHYDYGLGFEYIISKWVPIFIEIANSRGFDGERLINLFFVENPKRCFSFKL